MLVMLLYFGYECMVVVVVGRVFQFVEQYQQWLFWLVVDEIDVDEVVIGCFLVFVLECYFWFGQEGGWIDGLEMVVGKLVGWDVKYDVVLFGIGWCKCLWINQVVVNVVWFC